MVQKIPQSPAGTHQVASSGQLQASLLSFLLVGDFPGFLFLCKPDPVWSLGAGFPFKVTTELIPSLQFPHLSLTPKTRHRSFPFVYLFAYLCLFVYTANSIKKQFVSSKIGKHMGMMTQDLGTLQFSLKGHQFRQSCSHFRCHPESNGLFIFPTPYPLSSSNFTLLYTCFSADSH